MSAQASLRSWGMPSSLAMIFADPPGKITKGTPDPIRPLIASMSVPSSPKTARASTPSLTAALANLIASPASWVIDACHLMPASFMDRLRTCKTDSPLPAAGLIITRILPIFFSIVTFILTLFYYCVNFALSTLASMFLQRGKGYSILSANYMAYRPGDSWHIHEPQKWLFGFRLSVLSNGCIMAVD